MVLGATVLILDSMGWSTGLRYGLVLFGMNLAVAYVVFFLLDNSRLMSGRSRSQVRA